MGWYDTGLLKRNETPDRFSPLPDGCQPSQDTDQPEKDGGTIEASQEEKAAIRSVQEMKEVMNSIWLEL
jgi:hypothetical protein